MAKGDAYYLTHDIDAFSDSKIIQLRMAHGLEAYALYWCILERLFSEQDHTMPYTEETANVLKFDTRTELDVGAVIDTMLEVGLMELDQDGTNFYSPSLMRRMERMKSFNEQKSERGRRAAEARWSKDAKNDAKAPVRDSSSMRDREPNNAKAMHTHADALQTNAKRCHEMKRNEMNRNEQKGNEQSRTDMNGEPVVEADASTGDGESQGERKEKPKVKQQFSESFEALWKQYPRKQGKQRAYKSYQKAIKEGAATDDDIAEGIKAYKCQIEAKGTEPEYVAMGSTWFEQRRWQDDYDTQPVNRFGGARSNPSLAEIYKGTGQDKQYQEFFDQL